MTRQQLLKQANLSIMRYSQEFVPSEGDTLPVTIFTEDWITIEDRRPDLTEEKSGRILGYKYKVFINGCVYRITFASEFELFKRIID